MRCTTLVSTVGVVLCLGAPGTAEAQACFRGRPRPWCAGFTVLEFTGAVRVNDKSGPTDQNAAFFYWSGGYLQNVGPRAALGAAFKLTADSDGHRYGPVVRYRRWLTPTSSIDIAPGLFIGGKDNFVTLRFPTPTADVALNLGDRVGMAVGLDVLRQRGGGTQWQGHAGVRFGTCWPHSPRWGLGLLIGATW